MCDTFLLTLLPQKPLYANLGVIDPTGNLICSALPFDGPMDLSDRAYFRRAVETRADPAPRRQANHYDRLPARE